MLESLLGSLTERPPSHHDLCFGCGARNIGGLRLQLQPDGPDRLRGELMIRSDLQGPPSVGHGGVVAACLDEAMSLLMHVSGRTARTQGLEVRYLKSAPVDVPLVVTAVAQSGDGSAFALSSELIDAGRDRRIVASATAVFHVIGGDAP
jgi:acyl-coenzyme A thioesterase PaaI-like protein